MDSEPCLLLGVQGALPAELGEDGEGWVGEGALPAQGGLPGHLLRDG